LLRWSNAGHLPPLLVRDGEAHFLTAGAGAILGVCHGEAVAEATEPLLDGDVVVLYTDGLVERRGESLDAGLERLRHVGAGLGGHTADDIADGLLNELLPDASGRDDDVAILVAHVGVPVRTSATHRVGLDADPSSAAVARG